jgi:hypothetical protein
LQTKTYGKKPLLGGVVEYQWNNANREGWRHTRIHNESTSNAQKRAHVTSHCNHQLTVDGIHILAESIDDAAHRCCVKERHRGMHDVLEQIRINLFQRV